MTTPILKTVRPEEMSKATTSVLSSETLATASAIIDDVRQTGWEGVRRRAIELGDCNDTDPLVLSRPDLHQAWMRISEQQRKVLQAVHARIRRFAEAQLHVIGDLEIEVPGGHAGHRFVPIERVGCYIPGGRFPLPSTALMTITTARVAGCSQVVAASPKPGEAVQAAAYLAGADGLLCVGGATAIAVLAYGSHRGNESTAVFDERCDLIVGPGNRWVTAAKKLVFGDVGIDMLAGPSELVVLTDDSADPALIAADLLAQAEHDSDARPILITTSAAVIAGTNEALREQLRDLPTAGTATESLAASFAVLCETWEEACACAEQLAPEHLELHCAGAHALRNRWGSAGCIFLGDQAAEVFGDYGIGPNHTLPTGGTARFSSGLSVLTFRRMTTWLAMHASPPVDLIQDTIALARWEGLDAHARAAERRLRQG